MTVQKITPFLWFDDQAEEAATYYASIFKNSKVGKVTRYGKSASKAAGRPAGSVMTVEFELDGQKFTALNGGPVFKFSEAVSFVANCESQEELDRIWEKLAAGGSGGQCGWVKDKYGVSWQVVPAVLPRLMQSPKADKVMGAILKMKKLDIGALERAAA
ncbi:MAG TPA: VOC family protein [Burkholderiales bacterium]|jgi:predicted 3-demethylubiquinone-9 3-methyltransferase (glyoxalase superfamily)|nr:VOC family protein [Burkholderiales bacterium]